MGNNEGAKYRHIQQHSLSLLAAAEGLEFIFQQVSHPEYTVVLTLQWFQYRNVRGVM